MVIEDLHTSAFVLEVYRYIVINEGKPLSVSTSDIFREIMFG